MQKITRPTFSNRQIPSFNIFSPDHIIWQINCITNHVDHFTLTRRNYVKFSKKTFLIWIFQEILSEILPPVYELEVSYEKLHHELRFVRLREKKNGRQNSVGCKFLMRVFHDIRRVQVQDNNKSMSFTLLGTNQLKFSRNVPELNHDVSSHESNLKF
jgi:hypothetical protein